MKNYYLSGVIGEQTFAIELDAFLSKCKPNEEVTVSIDTPGGYTDEGFKMAAAIEKAKKRGVTVITNAIKVMSAGNLVYLAADVRIVSAGSRFMIHNCWSNATGNAKELEKIAAEQRGIDAQMRNYYAKRTGTDASFYEEYMDSDSEFGAETALKIGFATEMKESKALALLPATPSVIGNNVSPKTDLIMSLTKFFSAFAKAAKAEGLEVEVEPTEVEPTTPPMDADPMEKVMALISGLDQKLTQCMDRIAALEGSATATADAISALKTNVEDVPKFMASALKQMKVKNVELPKDKGLPEPVGAPATTGNTKQRILDKYLND